MLNYYNPQYGLSVEYPSSWSYEEYTPSTNSVAFNVASFFPVPVGAQDPNPSTRLTLTIENLPSGPPLTLEQYATDSVNYYRNNFKNFSFVSLTEAEEPLSERPAYEMVFTHYTDKLGMGSYEKGIVDAISN